MYGTDFNFGAVEHPGLNDILPSFSTIGGRPMPRKVTSIAERNMRAEEMNKRFVMDLSDLNVSTDIKLEKLSHTKYWTVAK